MFIKIGVAQIAGRKEGEAERSLRAANISLSASGAEGEVVIVEAGSLEEAWEKTLIQDAELIHFMEAGTLVLPTFYGAMTAILGLSGYDMAYCSMLDSEADKVLDKPTTPDTYRPGQMVLRKWMVFEIAKPFPSNYDIALREYRAQQILTTLCVR